MAKIRTAAFFAALFAFSAAANAITYKWNSPTYTGYQPPYTAAMRIEASITLASPLAANLTATNITADIQSWRFSDGINVYTEQNSAFNFPGKPFLVVTDGDGSITNASFTVVSPDPDQPIAVGNSFKLLAWDQAGTRVFTSNRAVCNAPPPSGSAVCINFTPNEAAQATLPTGVVGPWITVAEPSVPVPAMPISAELALILLLGFLGFRKYRVNMQ